MSEVLAVIVTTDTVMIRPVDSSLAGIQFLVAGDIEGVSPAGQDEQVAWHAYVNEQGKLLDLPVNLLATTLAQMLGWPGGDVLNGTVVFLGDGPEGDETNVPREVIEAIALMYDLAGQVT